MLFVALQRKMRMRHIVISGLSGSTVFLYIISQTGRFSGEKKVSEHKMCFDFLYNSYETFHSLRRNERDMIIKCTRSSVKYPFFFSDFNETRIFSPDFLNIIKYKIS
jgi:hypothetical protein